MSNKTAILKRKLAFILRLALLCSLLLALTPMPVRAETSLSPSAAVHHCAYRYWTVKGDTIARIAHKLGVPAQALADANHLPLGLKLRADMILCVPVMVKKITYPDSELDIQVYGNHLLIYGSNFPVKKVFYVRLRARNDADWVRLGVVQTKKDGTMEASFRIPKEYQDTKNFEVCLKEGKTGCKVCQYVTRTW